MYLVRRSLITLLLIGIILTSCGGQSDGGPTPDINLTIEAGAQTMVAALFQTQTALAPAAANTPVPTATFLPTSTALTLSTPTTFATQPIIFALSPTPTGTFYTTTPIASSLGSGCNNLRLIRSYTEPEGPFLPGQNFTQAWQVENNGTCDWVYLFELVFVSGDKLGEATSIRYSDKNPPGGWTTLRVNLHAPNKSGTYKSSWQFSNGAGTNFGSVLPVSITVNAPTKTPNLAETAAAQTAVSVQQTAQAGTATAAAATATCGTATQLGTPCP